MERSGGIQVVQTYQPKKVEWITASQLADSTEGLARLEYFLELEHMVVLQEAESKLFKAMEERRTYSATSKTGEHCYFVYKNLPPCQVYTSFMFPRRCREKVIMETRVVVEGINQEILSMKSDFTGCSSQFCCLAFTDVFALNFTVECPVGNKIGQIKQRPSLWRPHFDILDENGQKVYHIIGTARLGGIWGLWDYPMDIYPSRRRTDVPVGRITKQWSYGPLQETFKDNSAALISFPKDIDVKMKAVLLMAVYSLESFDDLMDKMSG